MRSPLENSRARRVGPNQGDECADRASLLEQRGRIQATPRTRRLDTGADLEVDVRVRITRT